MQHSPTLLERSPALICFMLICILLPAVAYAQAFYVPPSHFDTCSAGVPQNMVITRVVVCVEGSIRLAMLHFLASLSAFLQPTIIALFAFSMILLGIRISAGLESFTKDVMLYIVRFGLAAWFALNLGGLQHVPFDIVHYGAALVTGGWSPWVQMDVFMGRFFGYGNGQQLFQGIMGLVISALFSGITGILVFVMSMLAMLTTLYFGFRAVYSYLAAIMLISLTILISPIIIPLAVFEQANQRYVKKWIDYLVAAMIHPILLFAFLWMFMGTINYMLNWFIFGIFGGNDFSAYWRSNQSLFSWLITSDPTTMQTLSNVIGQDSGSTAMQTFMNPTLSSAVDVNPLTTFSLDFGVNQVWALQLMVFGFLGIFIVAYLMLSMVNQLPKVADAIAGVMTGLTLEGVPFVNEMRQTLLRMKGAFSS